MNTPEKTVPSRTYRIAVLPGDGIGKEVMPEGLRVTQAAAQRPDASRTWSSLGG